MHRPRLAALFASLVCTATFGNAAVAQEGEAPVAPATELKLVVEPASLALEIGETAQLSARVEDAAGAPVEEEVFFFSRGRRSVTVDAEGKVEAFQPGNFEVIVRVRQQESEDGERGQRLSVTVPVVVAKPALERLVIVPRTDGLFAQTNLELGLEATDVRGGVQAVAAGDARFQSTRPAVASFDAFGQLFLHAPGTFVASAEFEGVSAEQEFEVRANPVAALELVADAATARTGDVVRVTATARDAAGAVLANHGVPVTLSVAARPDDDLGAPAGATIAQDGRFVAETPGLYTIVASTGTASASVNVRIEPRDVGAHFELIGRGLVSDSHTSDLWVWEGVDGRDYAVTGTWGADGDAVFWDVTQPEAIEEIARVRVDARTVNDVKVSPDGRLCIIGREGASDRKNGIVLIDVTNPRKPVILSEYDEELTGGVHNLFIDGDYAYVLSAGRRYDVIDIRDPQALRTVAKVELDTPGHSIHDVWIEDGLAYSSNWADGVHIVDVGNGLRGGSPENPVPVTDYAYPSGWNHATFPYKDPLTGKFYVVAGDEAFPYGLNIEGSPTYARGWLHFIDFSDLENPSEVARYQVPEAGTHNLWIEDDVAYVAYYNGGIRAVDLSGELMGDLYKQGRELAWMLPTDPEGFIPNASMVWGPQPHKGNIFFSDWNSGLWCVRLERDGGER